MNWLKIYSTPGATNFNFEWLEHSLHFKQITIFNNPIKKKPLSSKLSIRNNQCPQSQSQKKRRLGTLLMMLQTWQLAHMQMIAYQSDSWHPQLPHHLSLKTGTPTFFKSPLDMSNSWQTFIIWICICTGKKVNAHSNNPSTYNTPMSKKPFSSKLPVMKP